MNYILQRSTRNLLYSITQNNWVLSACARSKKTDALDTASSQTSASVPSANTYLAKITLIQPNQSITVTTLKDAQKLAKRRELHLVKQQEYDTKTKRAVYKLVTTAEMISEDFDRSAIEKQKSEKRTEKSLSIGSRISDHDLASRLKQISKWLTKNHNVGVLIQGNPEEMVKCERIAKTIEQSIKEPEIIGRVEQKRAKGSHIKFTIVPVQKESESTQQA